MIALFSIIKEIVFSVFANLAAAPIQNQLGKALKNSINGTRFSRSEVVDNPTLIMGDRGAQNNGFQRDLYLQREVDVALQENFRKTAKQNREHNIVLITGRPASGKSRVVWEFIRSDVGTIFKSVYIPKASADIDGLKMTLSKLPSSTLIVFDDIDLLWGTQSLTPASFLEILCSINDKGQSCLITLSNTVSSYKEILRLVKNDNALGHQKTKGIQILEIEDIEKEDDTFFWCTANLPIGKYSKVIGGYILELSRHFDVNVERMILKRPSAVVFLASFIILKKFRNRQRVSLDRIQRLYKTIHDKDNLIELSEEPEYTTIKVLFDTGLLKYLDSNSVIEVDDISLFESFVDYCANHPATNTNDISNRIIDKYLSDTRNSEYEQIIKLIEMDQGNDPSIYSRLITRSQYQEHRNMVTNWFIEKFFDYDDYCDEYGLYRIPRSFKEPDSFDPKTKSEVFFTASIIIGREIDPINRCKEFIEAGVTPGITMVDELIRASLHHRTPSEKKAIIEYALSIKEEHQLQEDLYFCQVMESTQSEYDIQRVSKAVELYQNATAYDDEETDSLETSYDGYCSILTLKADSREKIDQYFDLLDVNRGIELKRSALKKLIFKISGKAGSTSAPLLLQLARKLVTLPSDIDEEIRNTGLICIMKNCPDVSVGLSIFDSVAPDIKSTMIPELKTEFQQKEKLLNIMATCLAYKMKTLSITDSGYVRIQDILKDRLRCACENHDMGVANKLFNIILNNQPISPADAATNNILRLFSDEGLFPRERDINNINSAFQCAIDANKDDLSKGCEERCKKLKELAFIFDKMRIDSGIEADSRFKLFLFTIIEAIQYIDGKISTDDIRQLIDFKDSIGDVEKTLQKEEILWCQIIRVTNDVELLRAISGKCLSLASKKKIVLTDVINHLYSAFSKKFSGDEAFRRILLELEECTYDSITHTVYDYLHYLKFDFQTGKIQSVKDVENRIDEAWTKLQHSGLPLRVPQKADLLCSMIGKFNLQDAIELVDFAIDYDRRSRYRPTPILSIDIILELVKLFRKEESHRDSKEYKDFFFEYAKEIQRIIYSLDTVGYPNRDFTFRRIKNPIDGPLKEKYGRTEFTRIPMESDNADIRRTSFLKCVDDDGVAHCSSYEAECFLYQELFYANKEILSDINANDGKITDIDDFIDYILLALESTKLAGMKLEIGKLNQERFCNVFAKKKHWLYFDNFFEGYLLEKYVPDFLVDRWTNVAEEYGFTIRD